VRCEARGYAPALGWAGVVISLNPFARLGVQIFA